LPYDDQGYGKKLLGGYHARIEGPYILYSPETDFYYLFFSYGGLSVDGGYNMRVARSKTPEGPYLDSEDQDMIEAKGVNGKIFYDTAYEPYGHKIMGNAQFKSEKGEITRQTNGYISPGHNSADYDETNQKYFLIFHTRFPLSGESHQVRVHQFFMNASGWPVVAPYRYTGETISDVSLDKVVGTYKFIDHGHEISSEIHYSSLIGLTQDGRVIGDRSGTWALAGSNRISLTIDDILYEGVFVEQYDENNEIMTMTFTAGSNKGVSLWGSMLYIKK
jgi:arabinan endo-1,5-alpha-L-arabinosidase